MSDDAELVAYVRSRVGDEYGLTEAQAGRLRGVTVRELRDDAKAMRGELGLEPLDDGAARDEGGRYAGRANESSSAKFNRIIREKAGR